MLALCLLISLYRLVITVYLGVKFGNTRENKFSLCGKLTYIDLCFALFLKRVEQVLISTLYLLVSVDYFVDERYVIIVALRVFLVGRLFVLGSHIVLLFERFELSVFFFEIFLALRKPLQALGFLLLQVVHSLLHSQSLTSYVFGFYGYIGTLVPQFGEHNVDIV